MAPDKDNNDPAPVRDRAREQLRECQTLIRNLFDAHLRLLSRDKSEPVTIMRRLVEQQDALRALIDQVLEHQHLNAVIEELRSANAVEDAKIAHLGSNLWSAESLLQNVLDDAKPRLAALKRANKRPVDVDEVISYGSKISASLSAPPGYDESNAPMLFHHIPPAPTEAMMRESRLTIIALHDQTDPNLADRPAPN